MVKCAIAAGELAAHKKLTTAEVDVGDQQLSIEAETYIGLTISGEKNLVESRNVGS